MNTARSDVGENLQFLVLQGYVRHCKENAPIYMYALDLLRNTGNAYDVTSYRRLYRPRPPKYFGQVYASDRGAGGAEEISVLLRICTQGKTMAVILLRQKAGIQR